METSAAIDFAREALIITLIVSGPILVAGVLAGLIISLAQAVTQLQDQTLSLVPKIVVMVVVAVLMMPFAAQKLIDYSASMFSLAG